MRAHDSGEHSCPSWMQTTVVNASGTHNYCQQCQAYTCGCR